MNPNFPDGLLDHCSWLKVADIVHFELPKEVVNEKGDDKRAS